MVATDDIELSADKKTVTITLDTTEKVTAKGFRVLEIKANTIKSADKKSFVPAYTTEVLFDDTTKPVVSSSAYSAADGKFTINFSEFMKSKGTIKVYNDQNVEVADESDFTVPAGQAATEFNALVLDTAALSLPDNKTYKVVIVGAEDLFGNFFANNRVELSFTKQKTDNDAPQVSSVQFIDSKTVRVTFNEEVKKNATGKVADLTLDGVAIASGLVVVSDEPDAAGEATEVTKGRVFDVKLKATTRATAPLTATAHVLGINNFTDLQGNTVSTAVSKSFQVPADTTLATPAVETDRDTSLSKYVATLTFNETVRKTASTANATLVTPDNIRLTIPNTEITEDTELNTILVDLDDSTIGSVKAGNYKLTIPAGVIEDLYGNSPAIELTFALTTDTVKPTVVSVTEQATSNNKVVVVYDKTMGNSALDVNNYLIDGQKVFDSAVFTDLNKTTVELTLKAGVFDITANRVLTISNAVRDAAGNAIDAYTETATLYKENVVPTLAKAELTAPNKIKLTFSEAVDGAGATGVIDGADFKAYVDGTEVAIDASTVATTHGTPVTSIELVLTNPITDLSKRITVKASSASDVVDTAGNALSTAEVVVQ